MTRPVRVEVVGTADGSIQMLMGVLWPVVGPLANTLVVIVIVIFMLLADGVRSSRGRSPSSDCRAPE